MLDAALAKSRSCVFYIRHILYSIYLTEACFILQDPSVGSTVKLGKSDSEPVTCRTWLTWELDCRLWKLYRKSHEELGWYYMRLVGKTPSHSDNWSFDMLWNCYWQVNVITLRHLLVGWISQFLYTNHQVQVPRNCWWEFGAWLQLTHICHCNCHSSAIYCSYTFSSTSIFCGYSTWSLQHFCHYSPMKPIHVVVVGPIHLVVVVVLVLGVSSNCYLDVTSLLS